jgi:biotin transport system substrate-specific component
MQQIGFKQDSLQAWAAPRIAWRSLGSIVLATAVVAICAHISVPLGFTPVPITMQSFAVILLGLLFSPGAAFACLALYLMEGAMGLPVFSPHGPGGMAQLLGPTGGYLLSYPFAAALASLLYRRGGRRFWAALDSGAVSSLVIVACGFFWLAVLTHTQLAPLYKLSVAPFLPGDALKVLAAALCASAIGSFRDNSRNRTL